MRCRASILLSVALVIVLAALLVSTMVFAVDAGRISGRVSLNDAHVRAVAWSGLQQVMAELETQRADLARGGTPRLTERTEIWTEDGKRGVAQLAPIGVSGQRFASESGKFACSALTAERAEKLPGVDPALSALIAAAAGQAETVESLGAVRGVSGRLLYGLGEPEAGAPKRSIGGLSSRAGSSGRRTPGIADLVTTLAFEPNTQAGVTAENVRPAEPPSGTPRIRIGTDLTEDAEKLLKDRLSEPAAAAALLLIKATPIPKNDSELVAAFLSQKVDIALWGELLDVLTIGEDEFRPARIDITHAEQEALTLVPGFDETLALAVVEARQRLTEGTRIDPTWLVKEGVLTADQFQQAAGFITTRSFQWRVRIEAVVEPAGRDDAESGESASAPGTPKSPRAVWEAVIDLTGEHARLAYLRDVTFLPIAVSLADAMGTADPETDAQTGGQVVPEDASKETVVPMERSREDRLREQQERGFGSRTPPTESAEPEPAPKASLQPLKDRRIGRWRGGD